MVIPMKEKLLITIALITVVCICTCFQLNTANNRAVFTNKLLSGKTVVIDAGHGGKDVGTSGVDGAFEKVINLEIAKTLYDFLMVCGINAVLIRNGDYEIYKQGEERTRSDLYNRLDFINSVENCILISIHQNHFENESEWGTQIWYSPNNKESESIANSILSSVKELIQPNNTRENKKSDNSYYILYKASVPSVMVECGFMSNTKENALLQDKKYQADMAFSILSGICNLI